MRGLLIAAALAMAAGQTPMPEASYMNKSPIQRVTKMLEDMRSNAIKEKKEDEDLYQNMDCWCKTNEKQKDEATKAAAAKIAELQELSERLGAQIEELEAKMKKAAEDMDDIKQQKREAAAIRSKENEEYEAMVAELNGSTDQLRRAIEQLRKVNPKPAPLKQPEEEKKTLVPEWGREFIQVRSTVRDIHSRLSNAVFAGRLQDDLLHMLAAFPEPAADAQPKKSLLQNGNPNYVSYASRSGSIVGILEQMFSDMNADAAAATKAEKAAQAAYDKLVASLDAQYKALREAKMEFFKTQTQAKIDKANADNDAKNTRDALDADQQFLLDLKEKCSKFDSDYEERQKTRSEEIVAIGEALKILTDDDARDTFMNNKAIQFLQLSASERANRNKALSFLRRRLSKSASISLLKVASALSLDSFKKVREMMDKMITHLQQEQKEEFDQNQQCIADIRETENQQVDNNNSIEDTEAAISELKDSIAQFEAELKALHEDITNLRVSIKEAGENRRDENKAYQANVNNQRATVAILNRVLGRLQAFYARKGTFLQQDPVENKPGQANTEEPENFKTFKTQENANGVMVMIQTIIKDAEREDQAAVAGEQDAQNSYANFISESNAAVAQDLKEVADKKAQKADAEGQLADQEAKHEDLMGERQELAKTMSDHHAACDFLLKNFEVRQASRDGEINDIQQAKAILAGAKFE